jgi:hypothetical protein
MAPSTCRVGLARFRWLEDCLRDPRYSMPQISAQMWNLWLSSVLDGSDMIAAEVKQVVDLIVS